MSKVTHERRITELEEVRDSLRAELQTKGDALAELLNDALLCLEAVPDDKFCSVRVRDAKARLRTAGFNHPQPTSASPANRIQLKDPTPSPMPAGGSLLLDQQPASASPAKLGGPVDAFREELVAALRELLVNDNYYEEVCFCHVQQLADRLERK